MSRVRHDSLSSLCQLLQILFGRLPCTVPSLAL
uniref:Uncharacterized protein n=1 Tax=Setaria viridis TaxID=4556 RepID=A0A4U6UVY3_SETVI|nr:hypothetical protein SEVIR_4G114901v2 [Setaria viridis]